MFFKLYFCYEGYIFRFKSQIKSIIEQATNHSFLYTTTFFLFSSKIERNNDIKFVRICERNSVNSLLSLSKLKNSSQKEKRNTDTSLLENSPKPPFL